MNDRYIPLSVPNFGGNELNYVTRAVETGWVSTGGPYVTEFEQAVAAYVGAPGVVSCQNGTAGLHLALLLCGVGAGDVVLAPTLTFIAAVNPITYVGAHPIFMDCDESLCLDPEKLERFCRQECDYADGVLTERATGHRVKAVLVVLVFGNMADMEAILPIARRYGLKVVEDATEALGTRYTHGPLAGRFAGTMGDVGVYSFNGNKIITTGGGGMLVSPDMALLERARHLSTQAKSDELYYTHDAVGYNYRMTNLQAALGLAQLEQLEGFIAVKERNFRIYGEALAARQDLRLLDCRRDIRCNRWFYALCCPDRDKMLRHLMAHRIQARPIWGLINDQLPYRGARAYEIEQAPMYHQQVVNIPCSSGLSADEVAYVADVIIKERGD